MAIIDDVKLALRIKSSVYDGEISDLIDAARADLELTGVKTTASNYPLIKRAIVVYCKAHFGYDNPDADRFKASYDSLKMHLALMGDTDV